MAWSRVNLVNDYHSCINGEITKLRDMNLESRNTLKLGSSNGTRWLQVQFIAISLVLGLQFSRFFGAAAQRGP